MKLANVLSPSTLSWGIRYTVVCAVFVITQTIETLMGVSQLTRSLFLLPALAGGWFLGLRRGVPFVIIFFFLACVRLAILTPETFTTLVINDSVPILIVVGITALIGKICKLLDKIAHQNEVLQEQIMEREKVEIALKAYRDDLEERVTQRTAELNVVNEKLQQTNEQLRQAKDSAEAASQAKSKFLANISHELRTPLNAILGYTQILEQHGDNLTTQQQSGVATIERSGRHLLTLINDILDISKIETGCLELLPTTFHLPQFLDILNDVIRGRAEQKGLRFTYETLSELPVELYADEKRLRQILVNLLGNAIKFTEEGGVTFKVGCHEGTIRFQVEDTGVGIEASDLPEIFLPFQQLGPIYSKADGPGLGLSMSQRVAQMMGSQIEVRSTVGEGSTFWFDVRLPEANELIHQA